MSPRRFGSTPPSGSAEGVTQSVVPPFVTEGDASAVIQRYGMWPSPRDWANAAAPSGETWAR